jgi:hypothetical protein
MEPLEISFKEEDNHDPDADPDADPEDNDDDEILLEESLSSLFPPSQLLYSKQNRQDDEDLDEMLNSVSSSFMNQDLVSNTITGITSSSTSKNHPSRHCPRPTKIGNTIVLNTFLYNKTKKCIVGPHWFGLLFTSSLLGVASYHFIPKAKSIGTITYMTCILLTTLAFTTLLFVGLSDPGIVMSAKHFNDSDSKGQYQNLLLQQQQEEGEEQGWRYCGTCDVYQPPKAAHCSDCNVCIDGYDHHCPWMGTCIGKNNFKPFVVFNMTWLIYLIYACIWVSVIGPSMVKSNNVTI